MKRRASFAPNVLLVACVALILWTVLKPSHKGNIPGVSEPGRLNSIRTGTSSLPTSTPFPRTITDARGKTVTLKAVPAHIVSLAPSVTEIVYALKLDANLAADTLSCDFPPEAKLKPHVDPLKGDREKIEIAAPDLILAVEKIDSPQLIDALEKDGIPVIVMKAGTLMETYEGIRLIGRATGQENSAEQIIINMQAGIATVERTVRSASHKPGVLMMYSDNPVYTTGTNSFITDIIRIAGGTNIVTEPLPSEILSPEKVVLRQPEVIICSPGLVPKVKQLPGWSVVPAVAQNRFFHESDQTTLTRPGPRLAIAAEELARYLHPDLFPK